MVTPTNYIAEGPNPILAAFQSRKNEVEWLIEHIKAGMEVSSNVVVCRNRATVDELRQIMASRGISVTVINKKQAGFSTVKGVYLSTFHSVKGLEFENVFVPFLTESIYPDPDFIRNAADEKAALADELKLLYVAATRSKYGLLMSYHKNLTFLFPKESGHYELIDGESLL